MSRMQLALNVDDLDQAVTFYSELFNTQPAKLKEGYANFVIAEPQLKLVLLENPVRAAPSTTSVSRSSPVTLSTPRSPDSLARDCSLTKKSAPPVASPPRTRSGSRGRATKSGRSTPCSPTQTPSEPARRFSSMATPRPVSAVARPLRQQTRRRQQAPPAADRQCIRLGGCSIRRAETASRL